MIQPYGGGASTSRKCLPSAMSDTAHGDGTHSYYDWQVSTLMLAYDAVRPLARQDAAGQQKRMRDCELEVRDVAMSVIPPDFQRDPSRELPPGVVIEMTKATLRRASEIVGLLPPRAGSPLPVA